MATNDSGSGTGGIDDNSGADDVRDALGRLGMDMTTERGDDGAWTARAEPLTGGSGESSLVGSGGNEDDAALDLWQRYLVVQGGVGAS
jgi:hypothetical protein